MTQPSGVDRYESKSAGVLDHVNTIRICARVVMGRVRWGYRYRFASSAGVLCAVCSKPWAGIVWAITAASQKFPVRL